MLMLRVDIKVFPNKTICADVKKNDILITFYDKDLGTDFVIIKSEDWLKALDNAKAADQKRRVGSQTERERTCECCLRRLWRLLWTMLIFKL